MHQLELLNSGVEDAVEESKKILETCKKLDINIITYDDPKYTANIKGYPVFPILFYTKGEIRKDWTYGIEIVGARRYSAKGIDSYAHTAAINNDGYPVAVLVMGWICVIL